MDYKNKFLALVILLLTFSLCIFPEVSLTYAKMGLDCFLKIVLPALFPFMVGARVLLYLGFFQKIEKGLSPIMKPLFRLPGIAAFPFIMGVSSGYPTGAALTVGLLDEGHLTKSEGQKLLLLSSAASPLFMTGAVATGFLGNSQLAIVLLLSHYLSLFLLGILIPVKKEKQRPLMIPKNQENQSSSFGQILSRSLQEAMDVLLMVLGFMMIFSVISGLLTTTGIFEILPGEYLGDLLSASFEISLGAELLGTSTYDLALKLSGISFLLFFGGFSILFQVQTLLSGSRLSFKIFVVQRFLGGIVSACITYILYQFQVVPVFFSIFPSMGYETTLIDTLTASSLIFAMVLLSTIILYIIMTTDMRLRRRR